MLDDILVMRGAAAKSLGAGRIGGWGVLFSTAEDPDLARDYFDAQTDFGPHKTSLVWYDHRLDESVRQVLDPAATLEVKAEGVWVEAQLAMRSEYERDIMALAEAGKLGWSSGTAAHLVEREADGKSRHIQRWPLGLDMSLTPTPCEPRTLAVPLKSLAAARKAMGMSDGDKRAALEPQHLGALDGLAAHADVEADRRRRAVDVAVEAHQRLEALRRPCQLHADDAGRVDAEAVLVALVAQAHGSARRASPQLGLARRGLGDDHGAMDAGIRRRRHPEGPQRPGPVQLHRAGRGPGRHASRQQPRSQDLPEEAHRAPPAAMAAMSDRSGLSEASDRRPHQAAPFVATAWATAATRAMKRTSWTRMREAPLAMAMALTAAVPSRR